VFADEQLVRRHHRNAAGGGAVRAMLTERTDDRLV
jgi:hypothetical protein